MVSGLGFIRVLGSSLLMAVGLGFRHRLQLAMIGQSNVGLGFSCRVIRRLCKSQCGGGLGVHVVSTNPKSQVHGLRFSLIMILSWNPKPVIDCAKKSAISAAGS